MLKEPPKDERRYRVTYTGSEVIRVGGGKFMNGTVAFLDEAGAREAAGMEGFVVEGLDGAPAAASAPPAPAQQSPPPAQQSPAPVKAEEKKAEEKKAEAKPPAEEKKGEEKKPDEKKAEAKAEDKKHEAKPPAEEKKADKSDKPAEAPKA
jgi:hypothetical protein